jgi:hypothetical protein
MLPGGHDSTAVLIDIGQDTCERRNIFASNAQGDLTAGLASREQRTKISVG